MADWFQIAFPLVGFGLAGGAWLTMHLLRRSYDSRHKSVHPAE
ncbi:hypothetical protein [Sphingobium chungbukense]|nr:hypothetical protein [Sphingobium chungbukense]